MVARIRHLAILYWSSFHRLMKLEYAVFVDLTWVLCWWHFVTSNVKFFGVCSEEPMLLPLLNYPLVPLLTINCQFLEITIPKLTDQKQHLFINEASASNRPVRENESENQIPHFYTRFFTSKLSSCNIFQQLQTHNTDQYIKL